MPLLGTLLGNLFAGLVVWFGQYFTRKVAYGATAIVVYSGLTLGLYVVMRAALVSTANITSGLPQIFLQAMQMAIPPIAPACISTYMTVWTACTVYTWQRDLLYISLKA